MWPLVIEKNQYGTEKCYDIPSRLLMDRIILLNEPINSITATAIIGQLLFLENQDANAPITIYINSPGGTPYGYELSLWDSMIARILNTKNESLFGNLWFVGAHGQRSDGYNSAISNGVDVAKKAIKEIRREGETIA